MSPMGPVGGEYKEPDESPEEVGSGKARKERKGRPGK